jgi:hypothetical protein
MENSIKSFTVLVTRVRPAEADVSISVSPESLTSTTQVRGRLVGPRCVYATTVEVVYPLRESSREYESGSRHIWSRAIIPEPNLWTPETPFLYKVVMELWQSGNCCDRQTMNLGLRDIRLGPTGLRVSSSLLRVDGAFRAMLTEAGARSLHDAKVNTLVVPVEERAVALWDIADRFGFLVVGRIGDRNGFFLEPKLRPHTCSLGWLLDPALWNDPVKAAVLPTHLKGNGSLVGLEVKRWPPGPPIEGFDFLAGSEDLVPAMQQARLPILIVGKESANPPDYIADCCILGCVKS